MFVHLLHKLIDVLSGIVTFYILYIAKDIDVILYDYTHISLLTIKNYMIVISKVNIIAVERFSCKCMHDTLY